MPPLLSVVIPVYNAGSTVGRTLKSLTHIAPADRASVEVIVVDDGSTDDGPAVVRAATTDTPFRWRTLTQTNAGQAAARNVALAAATGEWVYFLDADDELAADPLPSLRRAAGYSCVGYSVRFHRQGRPWRNARPPRISRQTHLSVLSAGNPLTVSSVAFRRSALERPFDPALAALEDWWFWLSNPGLFDRLLIRPDVTAAVIHIHGRNFSGQHRRMALGRMAVADRIAAAYPDAAPVVWNNLRLHRAIAAVQQGGRPDLGAFAAWPCNPSLYAKLLAYSAAAAAGVVASPYRPAPAS